MMEQNRKKYPTRVHEVLGVETREPFTINGKCGVFYLNNDGSLCSVEGVLDNIWLPEAINKGIVTKLKPTEKQIEQLKALLTLGYRYLTKDRNCLCATAYNAKPTKRAEAWDVNKRTYSCTYTRETLAINDLVSWSDDEPLDIVQTLRDNGAEME